MTLALLFLALLLPIIGAVVLRVLATRVSSLQLYGAATLIFGVVIASVLWLARGEVGRVQIGGLTLLLPSAPISEDALDLPPLTVIPAPDATATPTPTPTP